MHANYFSITFFKFFIMKKILLLCGGIVFCVRLAAQPMVTGNTDHVKLSDVVAKYKQTHPDYGKKANGVAYTVLPGLPKEKDEKDYQFERWLWYWKQHLDGNGYLVSPAKTWDELKKQQGRMKNNAAARTTSGSTAAWTFQGPDSSGADGNGVGRINVIAFHPTDANTYWIGSPGGGAWKTTNNGGSWTCMTDQLPLLSVSDIVFNPLNAGTVYLCTGDRDGQDYPGVGVLKSYDGGTTWNATGMAWSESSYYTANSMVINPVDTNSLILATTTGIERSFDGGATWTAVGPAHNFYQVLYCPGDTNIVYATTFSYGGSAQVYRSTNAGMNWTQVTTWTNMDRISLAATAANPAIVKALTSSSTSADADGLAGIYSSSDTGHTFTEVYTPGNCSSGNQNLLSFNSDGTQCGGQGFYDLPIAISPTNEDSVFIGGVNTFASGDGGATWYCVNQWEDYWGPGSGMVSGVIAIHADKHFIGFNPLMPGVFFESNDGGVYSTAYPPSGSGVWNNLTNGIGITEIYRMAVSNTAHYELLGAQDVGSKMIQPGLYQEADGGDGMECQIDAVDTTVGYTSVYNGYIDILKPISALNPNDISGNILGGSIEGTGGWITPFVLEPGCHTCILAGYAAIYKSTNEGTTWTAISPSLTSGDLYRVVATAADPNTIFATEDASSQNIYYTHTGGSSWTTLTAPYAGSQTISDIKIDPRDANHIWVTYSGYGSPQVAEWSTSGGWTQMNAGLPDVPVSCFAIDYLSRDIYVGTEIGVYYRDSTMTSWAPYTTGMPSVNVTDLEINYGTNQIWASTFGRSLWSSPKNTTTILPVSVLSIVPFVADGVTISPNPNHGNFTVTVKNIADKQVAMHVTDDNGKTVWQGNGILKGGKLDVNISGLVAGNYVFEIAAGNAIEGKQKLVIY